MKRMAIIAARSGSKGLPDKNVLPFVGKPLLAYSVLQAVQSGLFDCVCISSDSDKYLAIAEQYGANLMIKRPDDLANDFAAKPPVLSHALRFAEDETNTVFDSVFDLQPTSPLRQPEDLSAIADQLRDQPTLNNVVSVCNAKASPYYTLVEADGDGLLSLAKQKPDHATRRQDLPDCFELNGAIYGWRRDAILEELPALNDKTGFHVMSDLCNFDIDTELDFQVAEFVAKTHWGWT